MDDKKMKILMVENVKHDYLLMERALQRSNLDFEITRVLQGKDAFEYLHSGKFNIVILDYKLPRETGLEIFHQMKEQGIDIPVVFVSGSGNEAVAAEAIRLGAQEYIVKDPRCGYLEILADALEKALRQWKTEQSRKESKRKLEESEVKLRSFIESSTIGIWCFGGKPPVDIKLPEEELIKKFSRAICIECNETYAKMMGTTNDKIIGMKLSEVMPDTKENREYFRAFIRNGFKISGGISHEIDRKGEEKYFSNSFVGTIKNGKLIEAWGTQTDITEQKKAEDKLRFLSSITQQVTDCIIVTDLNFKITYINKAAEKMYGYSREEWL
ncbi:PAS domain S-box protein, partial [candidate division WOR-3 bacterium]|nr:PAS domain S-box protein [candidate division WOR-3 bacterium]